MASPEPVSDTGGPDAVPRAASPVARYVALAVLFACAVTYQVRAIADVLPLAWMARPEVRWPFRLDPIGGLIEVARPEARAAGLHVGDRVLAVRETPYEGSKTMSGALRAAGPGDALLLRVHHPESGGHDADVSVRLAPAETGAVSMADRITLVSTGVFLPLVSLALGFTVAALRPRDGRAWLLLLLMMSFAQLAGINEGAWEALLRRAGLFYDEVLVGTWPIWIMLFGIHFPDRLAFDRRHPRVKWALVIPIAALALLRATAAVAASEGIAAGAPLVALASAVGRLPLYFTLPAVGSFFAAMGMRSGRAAPDARRRLAIVYWGSVVGLTPTFLVIVTSRLLDRPELVASPWIAIPTLLLLGAFPLGLAYSILVHRAMDVRVVVRQGLQYALARRSVVALQVVLMTAVILLASNLAGTVDRRQRIQYVALGVLVVFLSRTAAERAQRAIDRRFFREAWDAERILTALGEDVRTIVDRDRLLTTVGQRLSSSLHVTRVSALLRKGEAYVLAYALGEASGVRFAATSSVVERLRAARGPLPVPVEDRASWVWHETTAEEGRALLALDARLLLPLAVKDELLGFVSLGPKLSEEPYSPSDMRLLATVAVQTAIALENSRLTAAIAEETALRARLDREIEIAREVQESLFPQRYPPVPGLEYFGFCRPARGVGGDYYDFVQVGGRLGIAIGDVSGKGVSAALLMASLQASLRAQVASAPPDPATLMTRLNGLIYDTSPENRYVTFFYGEYEPGTRRLEYVNAGHNAPMVFRGPAGAVEVLRVDGGGPVIGLLPSATYQRCVMELEPGDLFLAFTDGISEAMNEAEEEWGEERLAGAVRACRGRCPREVVDGVLAAADAFRAGAPQHDDMTLVVLRVAGEG